VGTSAPATAQSVHLRPAGPADEELLFRVYASTRAQELSPVPWSEEQKQGFLRQQFSAQSAYWAEHYPDAERSIIEVDGLPAGRLYVQRWEKEIRLVDIALLPEFRRRGVGTSLLRGLFSEATRRGVPVTIHVEIFNPARALYERLGFESRGEQGVYVLMAWRPPAAKALS
jgi:ribosomal protein S18 acetylase RimI-like enzyme